MPQKERDGIMQGLHRGSSRVLISTDVRFDQKSKRLEVEDTRFRTMFSRTASRNSVGCAKGGNRSQDSKVEHLRIIPMSLPFCLSITLRPLRS
ncbi:uncharacterized protein N7529_002397 [Penicillium soppii]|uniref:uncharacterized protein n=1 Tax=Penicillium soppii TaxID=69789 RepID=UPI0025481D47|nr:uncharacterized protein N7529_002397 [Penicillium soppii]KAJ5873967.1 hypothetical protein N7529_002397 [Penicillium soppii]